MSIKNKIHHTVYFLLFGIIIGILRWTICIVDTNGGMNFTPFLQAFLLIIALLLFVIWDIVLHKITLRVISTIILLCFNIWSYTYYFKIEELKEYWDGVDIRLMMHIFPPTLIISFLYGWRTKFLFFICFQQQAFHIYYREKRHQQSMITFDSIPILTHNDGDI